MSSHFVGENLMLHFQCRHCGITIITEARPGETVLCDECNTRQFIPETAEPLRLDQPAAVPLPRPPGIPLVPLPDYLLLTIAGWLLIFLSPLTILYGTLAAVSFQDSRLLISMIISGIFMAGLGQLLHAVRDIARNSWK